MNAELTNVLDMLSIAAVERDTGIAKDALRVWERRYNFPIPLRNKNDDRVYPTDQIEKLRVLKRLVDSGFRPGRIVPLQIEALKELSSKTNQTTEVSAHSLSMISQEETDRYINLLI